MFGRLFLLFTIIPLLELFLLFRIGGAIGALPTLAIVVITGLLGAAMARREGIRAWAAVSGELAAGRVPTVELMHGFLVLVAGVLLVTPGVLTDAFGFALLTRPVRSRFLRFLRRRFAGSIEVGGVEVETITAAGMRGDVGARREAQESRRAEAPGRIIDL